MQAFGCQSGQFVIGRTGRSEVPPGATGALLGRNSEHFSNRDRQICQVDRDTGESLWAKGRNGERAFLWE